MRLYKALLGSVAVAVAVAVEVAVAAAGLIKTYRYPCQQLSRHHCMSPKLIRPQGRFRRKVFQTPFKGLLRYTLKTV